MADVSGLDAVLAQHMPDAVVAEGEQLDLMNEIAQLPLLPEFKQDGKVYTGGRPKGARNLATRELAEFILSRHRHPVEAAAQIVDMPLSALRVALNCDMLDAAKYQQTCREFVARYTVQAMPQAVQVDMGSAGMLMVINHNAPRAGEDQQLSPFGLPLGQPQQNQALIEGEAATPHTASPHASETPNQNSGLDEKSS